MDNFANMYGCNRQVILMCSKKGHDIEAMTLCIYCLCIIATLEPCLG